jgi:hypothetical protein
VRSPDEDRLDADGVDARPGPPPEEDRSLPPPADDLSRSRPCEVRPVPPGREDPGRSEPPRDSLLRDDGDLSERGARTCSADLSPPVADLLARESDAALDEPFAAEAGLPDGGRVDPEEGRDPEGGRDAPEAGRDPNGARDVPEAGRGPDAGRDVPDADREFEDDGRSAADEGLLEPDDGGLLEPEDDRPLEPEDGRPLEPEDDRDPPDDEPGRVPPPEDEEPPPDVEDPGDRDDPAGPPPDDRDPPLERGLPAPEDGDRDPPPFPPPWEPLLPPDRLEPPDEPRDPPEPLEELRGDPPPDCLSLIAHPSRPGQPTEVRASAAPLHRSTAHPEPLLTLPARLPIRLRDPQPRARAHVHFRPGRPVPEHLLLPAQPSCARARERDRRIRPQACGSREAARNCSKARRAAPMGRPFLKECPAASYSPTRSPLQYHRR